MADQHTHRAYKPDLQTLISLLNGWIAVMMNYWMLKVVVPPDDMDIFE